MLSFLGFIFIFVLAIFAFGLTIVSGIFRALFGIGREHRSTKHHSSTEQGGSYTRQNMKGRTKNTPKRKKVFDEDEGEYVEFEEIK